MPKVSNVGGNGNKTTDKTLSLTNLCYKKWPKMRNDFKLKILTVMISTLKYVNYPN